MKQNSITGWNVLIILLFCVTFSFAQEVKLVKNDRPVLVVEFGVVNSETLSVFAESLATELQKNPAFIGYIITYRGRETPPGFPVRNGTRIKKYLVQNKGVSPDRIEFLDGGLIESQKTQLYAVPVDSEPPLLTTRTPSFVIEKDKTVLYDRFLYPGLEDGLGCCAIDGYTEEQKQASINIFAQQLKATPNLRGYIIVYGQYCTDCSSSAVWSRSGKYLGLKRDIYFDSAKNIAEILKKERNSLAKNYNIEASRIVTVNGGYKRWREIELYFVPENGDFPKAKPEVFPPNNSKQIKKKARKQ